MESWPELGARVLGSLVIGVVKAPPYSLRFILMSGSVIGLGFAIWAVVTNEAEQAIGGFVAFVFWQC